MKSSSLALLGAVVLLSGCGTSTSESGQATADAPATEQPAADSAAAPADGVATAPANSGAPTLREAPAAPAQTMKMSFQFKPSKDEENPGVLKTSVHILLDGDKDQDIDMGRVVGKPDIVDEKKAKLANFPQGMLAGFRSYEPNSGTGSDMAVMSVDGRRLRIMQRRIDEQANEQFEFKTAREITLPPNTTVVVAAAEKDVVAKPGKKK
ncbi:hypothetical protein GCM10023185_30550 [Hymenobacter saemangeumensis]|uniref:Lipoprotein n=1 Tax=Hymenobacter saemangeumensis TaxID=1084522 RepID=A0ABP8ILN0_9BACT